MKSLQALLLALTTTGCLLMSPSSQAETIFERFAPPLPPVIVPRIVIGAEPGHGSHHRPPPRYEYRPAREYHHHHHYYDDPYRYREPHREPRRFRERDWR